MIEPRLIERLCDMADPKRVGSHFNPLYGDAADEIERLEAEAWKYLQECGTQARRADALALQVSILTNERDEARALGRSA